VVIYSRCINNCYNSNLDWPADNDFSANETRSTSTLFWSCFDFLPFLQFLIKLCVIYMFFFSPLFFY
jgi:hypothetical protein